MMLPNNFKQSLNDYYNVIVNTIDDWEENNGKLDFTLELHRYGDEYANLVDEDYTDDELNELATLFNNELSRLIHEKKDKDFIIKDDISEPNKHYLDFTYR